MAATKKTPNELIAFYRSKIKQIKAKQSELDRTSPGMEQLLAALDVVIKQNKCQAFDVLQSISKIKKTGATMTRPIRKKKEPKSSSPSQTSQPDSAPKRQASTPKAKQSSKK